MKSSKFYKINLIINWNMLRTLKILQNMYTYFRNDFKLAYNIEFDILWSQVQNETYDHRLFLFCDIGSIFIQSQFHL